MFLRIIVFMTPPCVSIPKERGITSTKNTSFFEFPERTDAWIAAPIDTASSGFMDLFGFLPVHSSTFLATYGILVDPPTNTTSSMSLYVSLASDKAKSIQVLVLTINGSIIDSNSALVTEVCRPWNLTLATLN